MTLSPESHIANQLTNIWFGANMALLNWASALMRSNFCAASFYTVIFIQLYTSI